MQQTLPKIDTRKNVVETHLIDQPSVYKMIQKTIGKHVAPWPYIKIKETYSTRLMSSNPWIHDGGALKWIETGF